MYILSMWDILPKESINRGLVRGLGPGDKIGDVVGIARLAGLLEEVGDFGMFSLSSVFLILLIEGGGRRPGGPIAKGIGMPAIFSLKEATDTFPVPITFFCGGLKDRLSAELEATTGNFLTGVAGVGLLLVLDTMMGDVFIGGDSDLVGDASGLSVIVTLLCWSGDDLLTK